MKIYYRAKFFSFAFFAVIILAAIVLAASLSSSPKACSGQWSFCANAFARDSRYSIALAQNNITKTGAWYNYSLSIPPNSTISSVIIRADFFSYNPGGYIDIRVSGNGGLAYGPSHIVGGNTVLQTYFIDVTNDASWTPNTLSDSNFRVQATCFKIGNGSNPYCHLGWMPVNVTYI